MKKNLFATCIKKANTVKLPFPLSISVLILLYISTFLCLFLGIKYIIYSHDTTLTVFSLFISIIGIILTFIPNLGIHRHKQERTRRTLKLFPFAILCLFIIFNIFISACHLYPQSRKPIISDITLTPTHTDNDSVYSVEVTTNLTAYHINICINGIVLEELTQYHETGTNHIFTTTIETNKSHSGAPLTAQIILPDGKIMSSDCCTYIPESETTVEDTENNSLPTSAAVIASCSPVSQSDAQTLSLLQTGSDLNAIITANTNFNAVRVELQASTPDKTYETMTMHSTDGYSWVFGANFYDAGTFTIIVTAYDAQGNTAQTSLSVKYPFE